MNRIFRILWSKALRAWVVASELATPGGKNGRTIDRRATAIDAAQVQDAFADSPPTQPWPLRLGILMALMTVYVPVLAADRWWDPNNTAIGLGGSGAWNTTDPFWSINNDGVSGPYSAWNNAALDDAFFGGTAGTVTLDGPITVHNLSFLTNGYTLTGSTLTLDGTDPTITVTTGASTISSVVSSTSGLIKAGVGTLTLSNNNSFVGGLTVNAGTLSLTGNNSFGSSPVITGGALSLTGINSFVGDISVNGTLTASGAAALGDVGNNITISAGSLNIGATGGTLTGRTVTLSGVGRINISGAGIGGAHFTGTGGLTVSAGVNLTDDTNDYTSSTAFNNAGSSTFTSIGNLGEASSLGAPTTVANGTIGISNPSGTTGTRTVSYVGDGDVSNRNWVLTANGYRGANLTNSGTGTLTLTGAISVNRTSLAQTPSFTANTADLELLGVISGNDVAFNANAGQVLRLGDANTFTNGTIGGAGKVEAATLANSGVASSLGAGTSTGIGGNGTLSYTGGGVSSNRNWSLNNGTLSNDGSGALSLSGNMAIGNTATLGGSFTGTGNVYSGVISGGGNLRSGGDATWILSGTNTYSGQTIVDSGVLRAGTADAFGASTNFVVNGGTLDLNGFDRMLTTLNGTGGTLDLGSATLTLEADEGVSATYAGSITGSGGLTKFGGSTQTLTGASTYTGDTTIGGGTLNLNFSGTGGPTSDIIGSGSTLSMGGGVLNAIGAAGEANTQTFDGLNITAGNNIIDASSGTGGSITVNLGTITRTGGLMNFNLPGSGNITTTNTSLGGWATVNGTDYAKVEGGNILAFVEEDYTDKDNAANWLDNEFITDVSGFFGTVNGSVQLGGLRYTQPVATTVTVEPGETLGVDGTIIVAPSVVNTDQLITGGMITGAIGGDLGVQQNSTGNFTIDSQVVDNGGPTGFIKAGTGLVTLGNANNSYTGSTLIAQGTLSVGHIADGGVNSGIGASSADSSNLVMEGGTLRYTGTGDTSDRGFTFLKSGDILGAGIEVTDANANLTFSGLVTSPDDANFTKSGAGTLTLANPNNDYVGITTVTGGLLSVNTLPNGGVVSPIGQSSSDPANLVLDGGGLQYTGVTTTTDRGFTLGTNHGTVDVTGAGTTLTISGTVVQAVGNRRLTKEGDGTLVLSGTNTYTGGNTVNGGTLRAGSTQAFGAPSTAAVMTLADVAGVTLDLDGFDNTIGPLNGGGANGGNVTLGSATLRIAGGNGNYSGVISGTGGIWRTNGGTQTFNGCNHTYTGSTRLEGANISTDCLLDGGLASGIGASSADSTNLVFNNAALIYTGGSIAIDRGFQLLGGNGNIQVSNAATTLEFEGGVIGGASLLKSGPGTLVLSGTNTYTGHTTVSGGVLRAAATNAFGPQGLMVLNNTAGVLLDLDSFDTVVTALVGGGANGGNIDLGSATLTLNTTDNRTYAGAITGTGNLVKNGNTLQELSGCDSDYTGGTTINAGTLQVTCLEDGGLNSSIGASSSAPANLVINGTLNYVGSGGSTNREFTLGTSGGTIGSNGSGAIDFSFAGPVTLAGTDTARTLTLAGNNTGTNIFSAQLDDNGTGATSLTKTGDGLWRLTSATSSYTGVTTISGGILEVNEFADGGMASSIGAASSDAANLVIGNGSTLRYTGAGDSSDRQFTLDEGVAFIESSGTGALQFTNTGAVGLTGTDTARTMALGGTNTGDNTFGGAIGDNGTGATTLAKNDSGTWVLTGNNTYSGNTVINDGNLMIGNGGTTGNAGVGNVIIDSATSTLSLNRSDTFTFSGTLSGPGTLAQIGTGTSVLTSAANQVGATTISAGTLEVDGGLTTPTIDMAGNAALTVDGTVRAAGSTQTVITGDAGDQTVTVNAGGTLLANGDLGDGNDAVTLAGLLDTGVGTLALGDGDDTLTLRDGAVIEGGGVDAGAGTSDILILDNANALTFDGGQTAGFEFLQKDSAGEATMTGSQSFSGGTALNAGTLTVAGDLETISVDMGDGTTLNVDGTLQGGLGTPAVITGSTGDNTVTVGAGGMLLANGDLGDGNDVLDIAGTLDTGGGIFALGDGDDTLVIHDNTNIIGTVDSGAGNNTLETNIAIVADLGAVQGFQTLDKTGAGELNINGPLSSDFTTVNVLEGILDVTAGGSVIPAPGNTLDTFVASGATLNVDGDYGCGAGNDTMTVAGTVSGSGTIDLCDGDDTLTLQDGAVLANAISGGLGTSDTLVLDNAGSFTFDAGNTADFELLRKENAGTATLTGSHSFTGGTTINAGTLDVDGALVTPIVDLAGGTTLNVDGMLEAGGGTAATVTGDAGANTVSVGAGGTLLAMGDLGAGSDTLDVAGTFDTGGGVFALGDGDDNFIVHDGTVVIGTIDGGAGFDTRTYDINTSADLGALVNFEGVTKTGTGVLNVTGPGVTDLQEVQVLGGMLDVHAGASIVATAGSALDTTVAAGATLNVDGAFGCGDGADTLDVSGTVSGSGNVNLCGGDDTLILNDGANIAGLANPIDGDAGSDTVVLNNVGVLALDGSDVANFEVLQKDNSGEAILTGAHGFTGGAELNGGALTVNGTLDTPTVAMGDGTVLNVNGLLQAGGGTAAVLTGSAGVNTVSVGQGGLLVASGDLGDGDDVLDVAGALITGGGVFSLGDGSDTFTIHDGTVVLGTVDGGAGLDTFNPDIDTSADLGALTNFEILTKTGIGALNVNGPGQSDFVEVNVLEGTLNIGPAAGIGGVQDATVAGGATLNLDGDLLFTTGDDTLTVAGTVTGGGALDMGDGNDTFTIQDGANLSGLATPVSGGAGTDTFVADLAGSAVLGGAVDFETLTKTNIGILHVDGPAMSAFTTVNVDVGTLDIGVDGSISGVVTSTVAGGATLTVDGSYSGSVGDDTMAVSGAISGDGTIFFDDGDDVLTLNDGADLSGFSGTLDGGAHSGGDTVVLNNATDMTFGAGAVTNFEFLSKINTGSATLTGTQSYSGGTTLAGGELVVDGTLATPTVAMSDDTALTVNGTLDAGAGTAVAITGSDGVNTVTINGTALATGDLGAGEDVLDAIGTLDTGGGVFALGDGDDTFVVHDGTVVLGTVDGGAGLDTRVYDINLTAELGALVNFEGVTKTGTGVLNITGPGTTDLQEVSVLGGTLNIGPDASVAAIAGGPLDTVVASGATLHVDGSYGCGDSDDTMTVAGTVSGTGTIDLCGGEDVLTLQDGAVLANVISGGSHGSGDTVVLDTANAFTFDATNTINFEYLQKDNAGEATLVGAQSFTGGTTLNGGTLTVAGQLQTPTVAVADDTVLNVDGTLQAAGGVAVTITGSAGVNTVTVGEGGTLIATGDLGDGNDLLDVAGTLDTAGGTFDLGDGDDTLTIHDDTNIIGTVVAGAGNDTFNADIATQADLGAVQDFETLSKTGGGVLNVNGPASSDFTTVNVLGGTLNVTAGGSIMAQTTAVAGGATLDVQGNYTGTDGDDSFTSQGTVRGAFAFGDGNDTVAFIGGDPSGVTSLDGGLGSDLLSFSGLELESGTLPVLTSWERVELLNNSALNLANELDLGGGVLAIDGTSQLLAGIGAAIGGSVENAGLIDVGMNRLAISGNYTSSEGLLQLTVSPSALSAGGLDIDGDVAGTTRVAFAGDGSDFTQGGTASILVISSPNDNSATAGGFEAAEDVIRLEGSIHPWSFGQQADNNWYLNAEAGVLPEVPGYGVLPSLGLLAAQNSDNLIHQRLAGVRGRELPQCGITPEWPVQRAGTEVIDDCRGVWVAATGSEVELGANPGFEVSGDDVGLYVGVDSAFDRPGRTLRGGVYLGYRHGNYWTTGVNSTDLPGSGAARVQIDTLVAGMYMSHTWDSGGYVNFVLTGHVPRADIRTSDGFSEHIAGSSLTLSSRVGHRYRLQSDWTLEPQAQLTVSAVGWGSKIDQSGKEVGFDDDLVTTARTALRIEKEIARSNGALIRPWATFGVQKIIGQNDTSVSLMTPGATGDAQAFPNHQLGTSATLEVGVEATLNQRVSLFGVLSVGKQLDGTDYEQREANIGVRVRW